MVQTNSGINPLGQETGEQFFFTSNDGLHAICQSYPHATFLHVLCDAETWYVGM